MKVKIHWNIQKARRGIYEYSVTDRKTGRVTQEFGTNNLRLENAKLSLVKSAYNKSQEINPKTGNKNRKVYAQVFGDLVAFEPIEGGREISTNPINHSTPNFYFADTQQDIPFGNVGAVTFEIVNGKPVCKIV